MSYINMEITFTEINEQNPYLNERANPYQIKTNNPYLNETNTNYWEQSKIEKTKKKKVSFDDILTNMNLVVSKDGTLRSMVPKTNNILDFNSDYNQQIQNQYQGQYQNQYQGQYQSQPQGQYQNQPQSQYRKKEPIDPSVKHSFIYNKYFKDYKDVTITPEVKVPKTMEEYKKMLLENKIERIKQKKRISEIKSTKLFFTTNTGQNGHINSNRNNLKNMTFT